MIIEKNSNKPSKKNYKDKQSDKVMLNVPLRTYNILVRYSITVSPLIRMNHLSNIQHFLGILDPKVYENDPNKVNRIKFINTAIDGRLKYNINDQQMIIEHVMCNLDFKPDFFDPDHPERFILDSNEVKWANTMIDHSIKYAFAFRAAPKFLDVCTSLTKADFDGRGDLLENFETLLNTTHDSFRKVRTINSNAELQFSLRKGEFEQIIGDVYDLRTNPSRKLICGMQGLNQMINGGFESGRVYMFLGVTNVGKSMTLLNLMYQIRKYNRHYRPKDPSKTPCVVMLTMENSVEETIDRLFDLITGSDGMENFTKQEVIDKLRNDGGMKITQDSPIDMVIKYKPNRSVSTSYLYDMIDDLEDDGYEVICVIQDHVKRIRSNEYIPDIRIELGSIVNEFKTFAIDKDIPFITVSHLNREAAKAVETNNNRATPIDVTRKLGMSTISESFLMLDNLDVGIVINIDYDEENNKYMAFNMIKKRVKTDLTYMVQPFVYGNSIRLVEDVGSMPQYRLSLHEQPGRRSFGGQNQMAPQGFDPMIGLNNSIPNTTNTFAPVGYEDKHVLPTPQDDDEDMPEEDDIIPIKSTSTIHPIFFYGSSNEEDIQNYFDHNDLNDLKNQLGKM